MSDLYEDTVYNASPQRQPRTTEVRYKQSLVTVYTSLYVPMYNVYMCSYFVDIYYYTVHTHTVVYVGTPLLIVYVS